MTPMNLRALLFLIFIQLTRSILRTFFRLTRYITCHRIFTSRNFMDSHRATPMSGMAFLHKRWKREIMRKAMRRILRARSPVLQKGKMIP